AASGEAGAAHGRRGLPVPEATPGLRALVGSVARRTPPAPERAAGSSQPATLFVVATPIGNLGDVTLRALETLRAVPLIAAEDTRISRRLLARHGVETRLTSFHARSGPGRLETLLEHLRGEIGRAS